MGCFLKGSLASIGACVAKTVDVGMEGFLAPFLSLVCDLGTRLHLSSFLRDHGVLLQYMLLGQTTVLPSNSPSTPVSYPRGKPMISYTRPCDDCSACRIAQMMRRDSPASS